MTDKEKITDIWINGFSFDKFWIGFVSMIVHPKRSLRLINFAIKVLTKYDIQYESKK